MFEVRHTCPHCGHGVGRLMRVSGEGVSNCARCHKSDWSRRFPFSAPDPQLAKQEAREALRAEMDAQRLDWVPRSEQTIQVKIPERIVPPPPRLPKTERERLVEHVGDRKLTKSNAARSAKNIAKKRLLAYGVLAVGTVACFAIGAGGSGGDHVRSASAKPTTLPSLTASPSGRSSVTPPLWGPLRDYQHWNLAKAVADARKHHVRSVTYSDLSHLNRSPSHLGNWKVCRQVPAPGAKSAGTLTFAVLKANEACASPPRPRSHHESSSKGSSDSSSAGSTSTAGSSPASDSSNATELCGIRSNAGNCYHAGQFCRNIDVGATTTDAAGREITCDYEADANRWHY